MPDAHSHLTVLFGMLALRKKLITQETLAASLNAWAGGNGADFGEFLVERGVLSPADHTMLRVLLEQALARNGDDPATTLTELGSIQLEPATVDAFSGALGRRDGPEPTQRLSPNLGPTLLRLDGVTDENFVMGPLPAQQPAAELARSGAHFRRKELHAKGGLGQVFLAQDEDFGREVALKEIRPDRAHDQDVRERFALEAEINGNLEHPGIVPVYCKGTDADGRLFYVMRFIRGVTLRDEIGAFHRDAETMSPKQRNLGLRSLLGRFVDICQAIAYAHSRGVLHRDLKPANIMLGQYGETLIVDWGLAKIIGRGEIESSNAERTLFAPSGESHEPTVTGSALGTPEYMSPEQASGLFDQIGPATDIYGLGAILYVILTGSPPIEAGPPVDVLARARLGEIPPPSTLRTMVPRSLEAICMKALAQQPADRYRSARELAEDVEHWLADEPVLARRESWSERITRWERRNRVVIRVGGAALLLVTLVASAAAITVALAHGREHSQRLRAEGQEQEALAQTLEAQRLSARIALNQGLTLAEQGEVGRGLLLMAQSLRFLPSASSGLEQVIRTNLGGWSRELVTLERTFAHPQDIYAVAISPDGTKLLTGGSDKTARLWDLRSGRPLAPPLEHEQPVNAVAFQPGGRLMATATGPTHRSSMVPGQDTKLGGRVRIWDVESGSLTGLILEHRLPVQAVAFSPDGTTIATACGNVAVEGEYQLWDLANRQPLGPALRLPLGALSLAFRPDGKAVVIGCGNIYSRKGEARVWDARTRQPLGPPLEQQYAVEAVAFSPDGASVLTGSRDYSARLWDWKSGRPLDFRAVHNGAIFAVAFSPDGSSILTAGDDMAQLWDRTTGRPRHAPMQQLKAIFAAGFSPDGKTVVTAGEEDHARAWRLPEGQHGGTLLRHDDDVEQIAFSPDSKLAVTASRDGTAQVWNTNDGAPVGPRMRHKGPLATAEFSPDGKSVLTGSWDKTAQFWDLSSGKSIYPPLTTDGVVWAVAFSPDGRLVLTGIGDAHVYHGGARLWDSRSHQPVGEPLAHNSIVQMARFHHDGKIALTGSWDKTVKLWDVPSGKLLGQPFVHSSPVSQASLSPDAKRLAIGGWDGRVQIWDVARHELFGAPIVHQNSISVTLFSPDGQWLLTASEDSSARLWNAATRSPAGPPMRHRGKIYGGSFSPDGTVIATCGSDKVVRLWDTVSAVALGPPLWNSGVTLHVCFSPDGKQIGLTSRAPTTRIYRMPEPIAGDPETLQLWAEVLSGFELESDGHVRVLDPGSWNTRRLELERSGAVAR
jgi:WD40 repeat protein/serine/threonine protein kinase